MGIEQAIQSCPNMLDAWVQVGILVVALASLVATAIVERRSHRRFEQQLAHQESIAAAQVRPFICLYSETYDHRRGIIIENAGVGFAIITKVVARLNGREANCAAELFPLPKKTKWDDFRIFEGPPAGLAPGRQIVALRLSFDGLLAQSLPVDTARQLMNDLGEAIRAMEVEVEYTDGAGRAQARATLGVRK